MLALDEMRCVALLNPRVNARRVTMMRCAGLLVVGCRQRPSHVQRLAPLRYRYLQMKRVTARRRHRSTHIARPAGWHIAMSVFRELVVVNARRSRARLAAAIIGQNVRAWRACELASSDRADRTQHRRNDAHSHTHRAHRVESRYDVMSV